MNQNEILLKISNLESDIQNLRKFITDNDVNNISFKISIHGIPVETIIARYLSQEQIEKHLDNNLTYVISGNNVFIIFKKDKKIN